MSTTFWKALLAAPAIVGAALLCNGAQASEVSPSTSDLGQVAAYSNQGADASLDQVTSVSQLTDVRPTDWAFQALQSLVERYGCIVGYPDQTYRGNRALSRYEFAAGLNSCLDKINDLIAANTADLVKREDLDAVRRLQEEFAAELATLRGRVDSLEARTTTLEKQQFSTTTKLRGEVIFAIADTFGDRARVNNAGVAVGSDGDPTNTIFADRVRLNFDTSFNGKDLLRTRLEANNITNFNQALSNTGTNQTRLSFDDTNSNDFFIDELYYRFSLGSKLRIEIDATNAEFYDALITSVSPFASSGSGAISRFGRFSPIYRSSGAAGAGITFDFKLADQFSVQGGVITDTNSNDPGNKNGLFDGSYTALGQVVFKPSKALTLALTYVHGFYNGDAVNISSSTGSSGNFRSQRPFGAVATSVDSVGGAVNFQLSPQFIIGGWFAAQFANQESNNNDATILNGAVYAAFPDLGKKGSLLGLLVGVPPKVTNSDLLEDPDTSLHFEAFYRFKLNDNIAITPGAFVILDPEHRNGNSTQVVGTIRTTFTF